MSVSRMAAIEQGYKESQEKNGSYFAYVDLEKLAKLGMEKYSIHEKTNFLAIIPPLDEAAMYYQKVHMHKGIGGKNKNFLCPLEMMGKPCPICEDNAARRAANKQDPVIRVHSTWERFLFFVVDSADATTIKKGIQWFDAPKTFRDILTSVSENKRWDGKDAATRFIDVSDPDDGREVQLEIEYVKVEGNTMPKYTSIKLEKRDPIPDSWLDVPDYKDVLKYYTYEEIAEELKGMGDGLEEDVDPLETAVAEAVAPRNRRAAAAAQSETVTEDEIPTTTRRRAAAAAPPAEEAPATTAPRRGRPSVAAAAVELGDAPEDVSASVGVPDVDAVRAKIRERSQRRTVTA